MISDTEAIRTAIVGCGRFGRILAEAAAQVRSIKLLCAFDEDASRASELAQSLNIDQVRTYADILDRPDIEAVVIASPHALHCTETVAAASAGKHVFCEKPMAITTNECRAMMIAAAAARTVLVVGHLYRLMPLVVRARRLVDDGLLGAPRAMLATHSQSIQRLGWFSRRDLFGNLLHSPGVHSLDLMNYLLGEPASVFAQSAPPIQHQVEYPDTMTVTVTYANGCVGSLFASVSDALDPPAGTDTLRLLCENGALSIDFRPPGLLSYVVGGRERIVRGRSADRRQAGADHAVRAELENFAACIRRCATPFIDPLEASAAVALCEAAEISSCNKLPVAVACMSSDGIEWWSPAELPEVSQSHG